MDAENTTSRERSSPTRRARGSRRRGSPWARPLFILQLEYNSRMKVKTSISLSEDIAARLDQLTSNGQSRSEVIERLLRQSFIDMERRARDAKDLEVINRNADELNKEADDVLGFQVDL